MARFHVESKHTKQECLQDLDEMAQQPEVLHKFEWGCMAGDHAGYAMLEASSADEARSMLPMAMRERARITEVSTITPEQIKQFHEM